MTTILNNVLDQQLDVGGSLTQTQTMIRTEEPSFLGARIAGQIGSAASITNSASLIVVSGLTGMSASSVGRFLTISGAANGGNNGTFLITVFNSATSVDVSNVSGVTDGNNGAISWIERQSYSLEDDLNYNRTDHKLMKGTTNWYDDLPSYYKCNDQSTPIKISLSAINGFTTDAKAFVLTRKLENANALIGDGYIFCSSPGNLPWADSVNRLGVPLNDGYDSGNDEATYCEIIDPSTASGLEVLSGPNIGNRIYGRARAGTHGVDPNSFEAELRSVPDGSPLSSSVAYAWESGQPSIVDVFYPFRDCLAGMSETAFRTTLVNGIIADADLSNDIIDIRSLIGVGDDTTDLSGVLTNTGNFYAFSDLGTITPSVVTALNTLNTQIGNRSFSGSVLTDGETVTQSLQALANAIGTGSGDGYQIFRVCERITGSDILAGTPHVLPSGLSYTLDLTNSGRYMWLYVRGLLLDPGSVVIGDYEETDGQHITFYSRVKVGDRINYFIVST